MTNNELKLIQENIRKMAVAILDFRIEMARQKDQLAEIKNIAESNLAEIERITGIAESNLDEIERITESN